MSDDPVRAQYEALPYPHRDPRDEDKRLIVGSPSDLREVDHFVFAGRRDWTQPFRALVAGGGTGDAAIMMAQQLADRGAPGTVDYLDLSDASMAIARARAERRGLTNIAFHRGSLLDDLLPGPYDYVDCCGVLHHLHDPDAGLAALMRRLAPTGGMGLMVYAPYGRTGVYDVQDALRLLVGGEAIPKQLSAARALLGTLPPGNRLKRNPVVGDHKGSDDANLFDLLCHTVDRAFTVPEVVAWLDRAGLAVSGWMEPFRYTPEVFLPDPGLRARAAKLSDLERWTLAELVAGTFKKHTVYAVPAARAETAAAALPEGTTALTATIVPREFDLTTLANAARAGQNPAGTLDGVRITIPLTPLAGRAAALMDGRNSLSDIHGKLAAETPGLEPATLLQAVRPLYDVTHGLGVAMLRF